MADTDVASESLFRANKRRKVFRKRNDLDVDKDGGIKDEGAEDVRGSKDADAVDEGDGSVLRMQKRTGVRKSGIGFSSMDSRRAAPQQHNEETALVPVTQDIAQEMQNDRFVKPTGREVVTEDKHMYVAVVVLKLTKSAVLTA